MSQTKKTLFVALTLRGDYLERGIRAEGGKVLWPLGGRYGDGHLALAESDRDMCHVAKVGNEHVLVPANGQPERELVLLKEYTNGVGRKRHPNFHVELGEEVKVLSQKSTSGGSGWEQWTLLSAPLGWAEVIATKWRSPLYAGQAIKYEGEIKTSTFPLELLGAFRGDEARVAAFMQKVAALDLDALDEHVICSCGRARVQAHLTEVSGDPDFFLGADPNAVVGYIRSVFKGPSEQAKPLYVVPPVSVGPPPTPVAQGGESASADALAALRDKFKK